MPNNKLLSSWIKRFLMEHLVAERNLARNTQASYRDTLTLLLPFVVAKAGKTMDQLTVEQITPESVRAFLLYLEQHRGCSIATRNQRLSAIHALARFIGERNPEHLLWCGEIRSIPFKKTPRPTLSYLEKQEMDALLNSIDQRTAQGRWDYAMLFFLYNTGSRADETAHVTIGDFNPGPSPSVKIHGKAGKARFCPLWSLTRDLLNHLVAGRTSGESIFLNRRRQPITRYGVYALVKRCVLKASQHMPSLRAKQISPHTIRHTTAVHLLRSGVDINTIRAWLGHVSLDTTHIYAEVDLEMKAKALASCDISLASSAQKHWHDNHGLMNFLRAL